jgi:hypothetical protein
MSEARGPKSGGVELSACTAWSGIMTAIRMREWVINHFMGSLLK